MPAPPFYTGTAPLGYLHIPFAMKQQSFSSFSEDTKARKQSRQCKEHGGTLSVGKRRSRRPMNLKQPLHVTLRSDLAKGKRSLLSHHHVVIRVFHKFSKRFHVKVYNKAICGNHLHCLVKGEKREDLQNFFRVVAGHIAQEILRAYPLQPHELKAKSQNAGGASVGVSAAAAPHPKNVRKFWSLLLYSRVVGWGRDYNAVMKYILQNTKEALGLAPYKSRKSRLRGASPRGDP